MSCRKSQIAIEYAYRVRKEHPEKWVFWIHGSDTFRFMQDYRSIAINVGLDTNNPDIDVSQLVFEWLSNEQNGSWLLILDNADNSDVYFQASPTSESKAISTAKESPSPARLLAQSANGSMLVTSRDKAAAQRLVGSPEDIVSVEEMSKEAAIKLLKTKVQISPQDERLAIELVHKLGCIPLAIAHAAAYVRMRDGFSIADYIDHFKKGETKLLSNERYGVDRRDANASPSVMNTWQISFERIREISPSSAELLSFMSLLDEVGIPEFLLDGNSDRSEFLDLRAPLLEFALVTDNEENHTLKMHPLVPAATRNWLRSQHKLDATLDKALNMVLNRIPRTKWPLHSEKWAKCKTVLPHMLKLLEHASSHPTNSEDWAILKRYAKIYQSWKYSFMRAEHLMEKALEARKSVRRARSTSTL